MVVRQVIQMVMRILVIVELVHLVAEDPIRELLVELVLTLIQVQVLMDHQVMEIHKVILGVTLVVVAVVLVDNLILLHKVIQVLLMLGFMGGFAVVLPRSEAFRGWLSRPP